MKLTEFKYHIAIGSILLISVLFIGLLLVIQSQSSQTPIESPSTEESTSEIWEQVKDKTWTWDTFAGGTWTFFERDEGRFVVIQTYGSGVILAGSTIQRVEVSKDSIVVDGEQLKLQGETLISENINLHTPGEISLINYNGNPITLDLYLAVQSIRLEDI